MNSRSRPDPSRTRVWAIADCQSTGAFSRSLRGPAGPCRAAASVTTAAATHAQQDGARLGRRRIDQQRAFRLARRLPSRRLPEQLPHDARGHRQRRGRRTTGAAPRSVRRRCGSRRSWPTGSRAPPASAGRLRRYAAVAAAARDAASVDQSFVEQRLQRHHVRRQRLGVRARSGRDRRELQRIEAEGRRAPSSWQARQSLRDGMLCWLAGRDLERRRRGRRSGASIASVCRVVPDVAARTSHRRRRATASASRPGGRRTRTPSRAACRRGSPTASASCASILRAGRQLDPARFGGAVGPQRILRREGAVAAGSTAASPWRRARCPTGAPAAPAPPATGARERGCLTDDHQHQRESRHGRALRVVTSACLVGGSIGGGHALWIGGSDCR